MTPSLSNIEQQLFPLLQQLERKRQLLTHQLQATYYKIILFHLLLIISSITIGFIISTITNTSSFFPIFALWGVVMGVVLGDFQLSKHHTKSKESHGQLNAIIRAALYQHLLRTWKDHLHYETEKRGAIQLIKASQLFPKANTSACTQYWSGQLEQSQQLQITFLNLKERVAHPTVARADAFLDTPVFKGLFLVVTPKAVLPHLEQDLVLKTYRPPSYFSFRIQPKVPTMESVLDSGLELKNQYSTEEVEERLGLESSAFVTFQQLPPYLKQQFLRWYDNLGVYFTLSIVQQVFYLAIQEEALYVNLQPKQSLIAPSTCKLLAIGIQKHLLFFQELEQFTSSPKA